jgi:hypothetical protein
MSNEVHSSSCAVTKEIPKLKFLLVTLEKKELNFPGGTQFWRTVLKEISSKFENCRSRQ